MIEKRNDVYKMNVLQDDLYDDISKLYKDILRFLGSCLFCRTLISASVL